MSETIEWYKYRLFTENGVRVSSSWLWPASPDHIKRFALAERRAGAKARDYPLFLIVRKSYSKYVFHIIRGETLTP